MAKVDVDVEFHDGERAYRPGDLVTGAVELEARRDLEGLRVRATTGWSTHGSGTTDRGPTIGLLDEAVGLTANRKRSIPFSFVCPDGPFSYHGRRIKIDHYVDVAVAVPFGRDPKEREEFFVGPAMAMSDGDGSVALERAPMASLPVDTDPLGTDSVRRVLTTPPGIALWLLPVILMVGLGFFSGLVLGAAAAVGLAAAWVHYRPQLFARIITDLGVTSAGTEVHPEGQWPIRLQFNVVQGFKMTGMRVRLTGDEVAIDDSGTTTSTKRHTFHDGVQRFGGPRSCAPGDRFDETCVVEIPDTAAWSFEAEHNTVKWEAEMVLEIEGFPDWVHRTPLILVPASSISSASSAIDTASRAAELDTPRPVPSVQDTILTIDSATIDRATIGREGIDRATIDSETRSQSGDPSPVSAADPAVASATAPIPMDEAADRPRSELTGLLNELAAMDGTASDQQDHVRARSAETFSVVVIIDRVVRSMRSSLGDEHRRGREVVGVLTDRDDEVQIFLLESSTDRVAGLGRGDRFECVIHPHDWDGLYKRLVLVEAEADR